MKRERKMHDERAIQRTPRPLFVLWLSNQLKTDIEYWCDERVHSQTMKSNREARRRGKKHWTCKQTHSVCSAQNRIENTRAHYEGEKKNKPFLIICHNIYFCLVEWSRRISGIKCIRVYERREKNPNDPTTRQNKRQQSIRCWRFFHFMAKATKSGRETEHTLDESSSVCWFSSSLFFSNFKYILLFIFPFDLECSRICKYGHGPVFGNFQVFCVCLVGFFSLCFFLLKLSFVLIGFFLCLHFLRHLHTKSCRARTNPSPKQSKRTAKRGRARERESENKVSNPHDSSISPTRQQDMTEVLTIVEGTQLVRNSTSRVIANKINIFSTFFFPLRWSKSETINTAQE